MSANGLGAAAGGAEAKRVRVWPPTRPPAPGEAVRTRCMHCGLDWDVHKALAGFRLRCECDAWVPVPHPLGAPAQIASAPAMPIFPAVKRAQARREEGQNGRPGLPQRLKREKPKKPAPPRGKRARVMSGSVLGTLLLSALVAAPVVWVQSEYFSLSWAVLWPAMGGLAAVLLGFAALLGRARYMVSLRAAQPRHLAEGLGAGLLGGALLASLLSSFAPDTEALTWIQGLIGELGVPTAAVALVLLPALGHALFFREVFARRLQGLVNPRAAGFLAAGALALSHGLGAFTPVVAVMALHATWLRNRSRSSVPGLIEDLAIAGVVFGSLIAA